MLSNHAEDIIFAERYISEPDWAVSRPDVMSRKFYQGMCTT